MWFLDHNLQLSKFFHLYLLGCLPYPAVQFNNIGRYRLQPYSGDATPAVQSQSPAVYHQWLAHSPTESLDECRFSSLCLLVYLLVLRLSLSFFILYTSHHVDYFFPAIIFCTILFSWQTRPTWWKKLKFASRCTAFKELESGHFISIEPIEDFPNWIDDLVDNTVSERSILTGDFLRFNSKNQKSIRSKNSRTVTSLMWSSTGET
jgi:hypothetical protein